MLTRAHTPVCTQAGASSQQVAGVLERHELLQLALAHVQLWECWRICRCSTALRQPGSAVAASLAVFRLAVQPVSCAGAGDSWHAAGRMCGGHGQH